MDNQVSPILDILDRALQALEYEPSGDQNTAPTHHPVASVWKEYPSLAASNEQHQSEFSYPHAISDAAMSCGPSADQSGGGYHGSGQTYTSVQEKVNEGSLTMSEDAHHPRASDSSKMAPLQWQPINTGKSFASDGPATYKSDFQRVRQRWIKLGPTVLRHVHGFCKFDLSRKV